MKFQIVSHREFERLRRCGTSTLKDLERSARFLYLQRLAFGGQVDEAEAALKDWMAHCDEVALYDPDDPLFPATAIVANSNAGFAAIGLTRQHWKTTEPVRKIVRTAFETAGIPNYGPHAFRHMLARHAAKHCTSVAELVATSQNLGHTDVLTPLRSYGQISRDEQRKLITGASDDD